MSVNTNLDHQERQIAAAVVGLQAQARPSEGIQEPRKQPAEAQVLPTASQSTLGALAPSADRLPAVLGLLACLAERGVSVSTLAKSWTSAAKILPQEVGYPAGLDSAGLNELLAGAEREGLLVRQAYRDTQRKLRTRWTLTPAGLRMLAAGDGLEPAHFAMAEPAQNVRKELAEDPLEACLRALDVAMEEAGGGVCERDAWLSVWCRLEGGETFEAVHRFGAAVKKLRAEGAVGHAAGLVWRVS